MWARGLRAQLGAQGPVLDHFLGSCKALPLCAGMRWVPSLRAGGNIIFLFFFFLFLFFADCSQCFFPRNKHPLQPPPSDGKCFPTSPAIARGTAPAGGRFGLLLVPSSLLHSSRSAGREVWQSCLPRKVFLESSLGCHSLSYAVGQQFRECPRNPAEGLGLLLREG